MKRGENYTRLKPRIPVVHETFCDPTYQQYVRHCDTLHTRRCAGSRRHAAYMKRGPALQGAGSWYSGCQNVSYILVISPHAHTLTPYCAHTLLRSHPTALTPYCAHTLLRLLRLPDLEEDTREKPPPPPPDGVRAKYSRLFATSSSPPNGACA